jgi:aspartate racemase
VIRLVEKIIGILGGMGPEATAALYMNIIRATKVEKDQDHFRIIIDSNAKIPDRTPAIIGDGENPIPLMVETGKNLQKAGVDFIIMPCNTAHHFFDQLQSKLNVPILHMIKLTALYTRENYPQIKKAGLLATDGTLASMIYEKTFAAEGINIIKPEFESQKSVMKAIYNYIKIGDLKPGKTKLHTISKELIDKGAEIIICGCTEVSLVLHDGDLNVPVIDPMHVLALNSVKFAISENI